MLRDLTVQNYRCFKDFHIDGLERVNLFVGNNNSGKTSLLEAVYLLSSPNKYNSLIEILFNRREVIIQNEEKNLADTIYKNRIDNLYHIESISSIFFQYKLQENHKINIYSTLPNRQNNLYTCLSIVKSIPNYIQDELLLVIFDKNKANVERKTEFEITSEDNNIVNLFLNKASKDNYIYLSINKNNLDKVQNYWDDIYLTKKEDLVVKAIQIIEPEVERIGFYRHEFYTSVKFKMNNYNYPIPLSSMGEGMYIILTLAMSLVTAENGVLLVDEIETGLHYEAQTDMWRLILETAKELNVQVFATTHSWDCIAAFQEALSQMEDKSIGKLFRLDNKYGEIRAVEYNAEDLDIAVRNSIEVR